MRKQKKGKVLLLFFILLVVDQVSKYLFYDIHIWEGVSILHPLINYGVSRSIMINKTVVISLSFLAVIIFAYLFKKKTISRSVTAFFLAGTIGNLCDRIFLGGVRDFVDIGILPVFNAADIWLNVGILLMIFQELSSGKKKQES